MWYQKLGILFTLIILSVIAYLYSEGYTLGIAIFSIVLGLIFQIGNYKIGWDTWSDEKKEKHFDRWVEKAKNKRKPNE